jgi:hypothetical protein
LELRGGGDLAQSKVEAIVVVAVAEIVDIVSLNGVSAVIQSTLPSSLPGSREIGLQRRRTSVQYADHVSIHSPAFTKSLFKLREKLFEWITLGLS